MDVYSIIYPGMAWLTVRPMLDPSMDASNLGSDIRLGQSEIGRVLSLDADIYIYSKSRRERERNGEREQTIDVKWEKNNEWTIVVTGTSNQPIRLGPVEVSLLTGRRRLDRTAPVSPDNRR